MYIVLKSKVAYPHIRQRHGVPLVCTARHRGLGSPPAAETLRSAAGPQGRNVPLEQVPFCRRLLHCPSSFNKGVISQGFCHSTQNDAVWAGWLTFLWGNKQQLKTTVNLTKPQVCPSERGHVRACAHAALDAFLPENWCRSTFSAPQQLTTVHLLEVFIAFKVSSWLLTPKKVALRQEMGWMLPSKTRLGLDCRSSRGPEGSPPQPSPGCKATVPLLRPLAHKCGLQSSGQSVVKSCYSRVSYILSTSLRLSEFLAICQIQL